MPCDQKDPEVVFGPSVFLDAWGTLAKKLHFEMKTVVFVALPPSAARLNKKNNYVYETNVGFGTPGLPKTTWRKQQQLRDFFDCEDATPLMCNFPSGIRDALHRLSERWSATPERQ